MRPGRWTKGKENISSIAFPLRVSIRCPKHKAGLAHAIIPPPAQHLCKSLRSERLAALIKQDCLTRGLWIRNAPTSFGQFGELHGPSEPLFIARDQLRFW